MRSARSRCSGSARGRSERRAAGRSSGSASRAATAPFSSTALFVTFALFAGLLASALLARAQAGARSRSSLWAASPASHSRPTSSRQWRPISTRSYAPTGRVNISPAPRNTSSTRRGTSWCDSGRTSPCRRRCSSCCSASAWWCWFALSRCVAIAMPLLWLEMALIGRLRRYPYLDLRTSQFLLCRRCSWSCWARSGSSAPPGVAARARARDRDGRGGGGGRGAGCVVRGGCVHYIRQLNIPSEDVRSETFAVAAQQRAHHVVLVNESANFGFLYYWPHGRMTFHHDQSGQGFGTTVVGVNAIYVPTRAYNDIADGLREAVDRWHRAGAGSRLYIVRTHVSSDEEAAWSARSPLSGSCPGRRRSARTRSSCSGPPEPRHRFPGFLQGAESRPILHVSPQSHS